MTGLHHRWIRLLLGLAAIGLCLPSRSRDGRLWHWWLLAGVLFVVVAGYASS